ncbi:MAG: 2,3-bisphosphoglycerate-independent phosphoglycerate mutase [Candidatus Thiodiazotropha sp. (ex Monitilora ramsayi)]|nr:2,3-bisphosphoglycerate-independent phosphoglycerate mutase [Candidatus Thiodiazotropha sp. (ex Monitilora ramsayi)]
MAISYQGLIIIIDGLGDRGIPGFGGQTPLEAADTPNMDRLADAGQCGLIDPLHSGMPVGTHTGIGLLFGLPKRQALKLARGPVEASGIGISHKEHNIYIRCNFATLEKTNEGYAIIDRRAGRVDEGFAKLASELGSIDLGEGIQASLHPATQHRAVLQLSGDQLSHRISNTDPGNKYRTQGVRRCDALSADDTAAVRTADAVNRVTDHVYDLFSTHPINQLRIEKGYLPANGIICRSPGEWLNFRSLIQHFKINAAVISGEQTVLGLGKLFGFTLFRDPCFTALPDTDLQKKIETTQAALQSHDLVFLHIKGPDICSHDQDPAAKRLMLSKIDDAIAPLMSESLVIGITGDHSTDSNTGRHTGDPVPGLIYGPQCRVDASHAFGEASCVSGGLSRIDSTGFLLTMLDHMNRLENLRMEDRDFFL